VLPLFDTQRNPVEGQIVSPYHGDIPQFQERGSRVSHVKQLSSEA
jgi:hypothetical protein